MRKSAGVLVLYLGVLWMAPVKGQAGWSRLHVSDPWGRRVLEEALNGAAARLSKPDCADVFTFYLDRNGRPLAAKLAALRLTPAEYLRFVIFQDGGSRQTCEGEQHAYTHVGSRVVFLCVARFVVGWQRNRAYAEAALIHEALHTLGLGENPPSSSDITDRVRRACGTS